MRFIGTRGIPEVIPSLKTVDYHLSFPESEGATLLRRALLYCSKVSGCNITRIKPQDVTSVS